MTSLNRKCYLKNAPPWGIYYKKLSHPGWVIFLSTDMNVLLHFYPTQLCISVTCVPILHNKYIIHLGQVVSA